MYVLKVLSKCCQKWRESHGNAGYKCHVTRAQDSANIGGKVNMKRTMEMLVLVAHHTKLRCSSARLQQMARGSAAADPGHVGSIFSSVHS